MAGLVDENLKEWAKASKNFALIDRLVATASDAHAMDAYYHLVCYTHLQEAALTANRQESKIYSLPFDAIICAQIVAFIEHSKGVFKLSELQEMYQELMSCQGNPCKDRKEPRATRFKDHLLSLLPEWSKFSRKNKERKDIYISHKVTVADELAKKHNFQSCLAEALILMHAAMIIHKLCPESQEPFNGSFSANCLTAPVNKNMRIFFNTVLQGQSTVFGKNINDNTNQDARDKIACIISQSLMYNASKGVHHTVKTDTVHHSKEREIPFPLCYGLKLHALGRQKNQIGIAQDIWDNRVSVYPTGVSWK